MPKGLGVLNIATPERAGHVPPQGPSLRVGVRLTLTSIYGQQTKLLIPLSLAKRALHAAK